jgi:hypothetical protein
MAGLVAIGVIPAVLANSCGESTLPCWMGSRGGNLSVVNARCEANPELCLARSDFATASSIGDLVGRPAVAGGIVALPSNWPGCRRIGRVGDPPAGTKICEPLRVAVWVEPWPVTRMALP